MQPACLGGEIGRRAGLKIRFRKECRFDSDPRHQPLSCFVFDLSQDRVNLVFIDP